jgi:RNA polymerase sigma factor (sigma-70 family)
MEPMANWTDSELFAGCIAGNKKAQESFVRQFSDLVYRSVHYALRSRGAGYSRQDVEDLHNTVFVKVLEKRCRKLRQYKGKNGCSIASWIRLITVRIVLDYLRKSRTDALTQPERILPLDSMANLVGDVPEPWRVMDHKEQRRLLKDALDDLLPRDRLFLKLHCIEGLSIGDVAGLMRLSESNAYSLKHRAIKRLREKMPVEVLE